MKMRRVLLLILGIAALGSCFVYDMIRSVISAATLGSDAVHILLSVSGFVLLASYFLSGRGYAEFNPARAMGKIALLGLGLILFWGVIITSSLGAFDYENGILIPRNIGTVVSSTAISVVFGIAAIVTFLHLTDLIFLRRRKGTRKNYIILLVTGGLYILSVSAPITWWEQDTAIVWLLYACMVIAILLNSSRLTWIVYLSRREKLFNLLFSLAGMVLFVVLAVFSHESSNLMYQSLRFYQPSLSAFVSSVFLIAAIYQGIGFASTLFQLPTAEAFDRKKIEMSSLQNMSRLINQVLDHDELLSTTANLARDVAEGSAAWLRFHPADMKQSDRQAVSITPAHRGRAHPELVLSDGAESFAISELRLQTGDPIESLVYEAGKPVIIQDFASDRRVDAGVRQKKQIGSAVLIPLTIDGRVVGVLGVLKTIVFGFDRDILDALLAFTDLVHVALENSRLIDQSIVKERLEQELMVAQEMQQKLLPQALPEGAEFEMSAMSLPAYEVGGDYFDVVRLDEDRLGFVIGDVSGKGVSAALYMAQVKGIFQSLCMQSPSAKDLLIKTNSALYGNIDRKSFVSLLYAILELSTGTLTFARAGHCPVLYMHGDVASYLKPGGMGLGLDNTERFLSSIEEETLTLRKGDLIILYTDGITEARNGVQEEYGYDRLSSVVARERDTTTHHLMNRIIGDVKSFTGAAAAEDDITLLLLRWKGRTSRHRDEENIHRVLIET